MPHLFPINYQEDLQPADEIALRDKIISSGRIMHAICHRKGYIIRPLVCEDKNLDMLLFATSDGNSPLLEACKNIAFLRETDFINFVPRGDQKSILCELSKTKNRLTCLSVGKKYYYEYTNLLTIASMLTDRETFLTVDALQIQTERAIKLEITDGYRMVGLMFNDERLEKSIKREATKIRTIPIRFLQSDTTKYLSAIITDIQSVFENYSLLRDGKHMLFWIKAGVFDDTHGEDTTDQSLSNGTSKPQIEQITEKKFGKCFLYGRYRYILAVKMIGNLMLSLNEPKFLEFLNISETIHDTPEEFDDVSKPIFVFFNSTRVSKIRRNEDEWIVYTGNHMSPALPKAKMIVFFEADLPPDHIMSSIISDAFPTTKIITVHYSRYDQCAPCRNVDGTYEIHLRETTNMETLITNVYPLIKD